MTQKILMPSRWIALVLGSAALLFSQQWPNKEDHHHARDRERWFYDQRTWPNSSIPPGARRNSILQMRRNDAQSRSQRQAARRAVSAAQAFAITTDSANWTSIGPRPTDPGASATSGRVNAIAIDPRDNNVAYIGAAEGGVWNTTDGGANWSRSPTARLRSPWVPSCSIRIIRISATPAPGRRTSLRTLTTAQVF